MSRWSTQCLVQKPYPSKNITLQKYSFDANATIPECFGDLDEEPSGKGP